MFLSKKLTKSVLNWFYREFNSSLSILSILFSSHPTIAGPRSAGRLTPCFRPTYTLALLFNKSALSTILVYVYIHIYIIHILYGIPDKNVSILNMATIMAHIWFIQQQKNGGHSFECRATPIFSFKSPSLVSFASHQCWSPSSGQRSILPLWASYTTFISRYIKDTRK